jgi:protein-disulfide isomerase
MKKSIVGLLGISLLAFAACDPPKTLDKSDKPGEASEEHTETQRVESNEKNKLDIPREEMSWLPEQPADMDALEVAYVPTEGEAARGADEQEALVTIVEFGDYGCPDTEARRDLVQGLLKNYGSKVRYVYRNVVWVPGEYGPFAANLASAAAQNNNYWKAYEIIWQRFRKLDEYDKKSYLEPLDLTLRDLQRAETFAKNRMDANQKLAKELDIQWVPTFFVNGVPMVKVDDETFEKFVEVQIDKAQALREENPELQGKELYRALVEENAAIQELPESDEAEQEKLEQRERQ